MKWTPKLLKLGLNVYGPYLGAGVKVTQISNDWRHIDVEMKLRWYNKNFMKVHFGGSLYAMVDPHLMLMLIQILGNGYHVWDKSAEIEFVKPGRGTVRSQINISDEDLTQIKRNTQGGNKYFHTFDVLIKNEDKSTSARIKKVLYIKKKK